MIFLNKTITGRWQRDWRKIVFFGPWFLVFPFLLAFEIKKLDLKETWGVGEKVRKNHFLKVAMPVFGEDYFELLEAAENLLGKAGHRYDFEIGPGVGYELSLLGIRYGNFWLMPSRPARNPEEIGYRIHFRTAPKDPRFETIWQSGKRTFSFISRKVVS